MSAFIRIKQRETTTKEILVAIRKEDVVAVLGSNDSKDEILISMRGSPEPIRLNFPDVSVDDVLELLER